LSGFAPKRLKASSESEIDAAFTSLVQQHAGALIVGAARMRSAPASLKSHA
jgi:hypothetical protein